MPKTCTRAAVRRLSSCVTDAGQHEQGRRLPTPDPSFDCRRSSASAVAKKRRWTTRPVRCAEPGERQVAQARPDRRANQQRAGQHRHRDGHAGDHQCVQAAISARSEAKTQRRFMTQLSYWASECPRVDSPSSSEAFGQRLAVRHHQQDRLLVRWCSASSSSATRSAESASRLPVGSSHSSSRGSRISARAIATRCFSPPDSAAGR